MASRFLYLLRHGEAAQDGSLTVSGEQQAHLTGERLRGVPLAAIHHSPQARAVRTAQIIGGYLPGVLVLESVLIDDYIPSDPDPAELPGPHARLVETYSRPERSVGAGLALEALERFAVAGPPDADSHELLITHNFVIGWFVRDALGAADWRWLGLNQQNAALTVIMYSHGMPPALVSFNDAAHLTGPLRWTGFPAALRPATC
ncbi:MAG TPA: histidine phosphatase family protein [Streptosporangiaceae bacterium]|nr:histidine phosphatase family protein [Streptosporangiaceae bacterium]